MAGDGRSLCTWATWGRCTTCAAQHMLFFKLSIDSVKNTRLRLAPQVQKQKENWHSVGTFPTLQVRFQDISNFKMSSDFGFGAQFLRSFVAQHFASPHFHGGLRMCQIGSLLELWWDPAFIACSFNEIWITKIPSNLKNLPVTFHSFNILQSTPLSLRIQCRSQRCGLARSGWISLETGGIASIAELCWRPQKEACCSP